MPTHDSSSPRAGGASRGRLLLVRHGESEGNRERRFSPNPEILLTERGVEQACATAELIRGHFRPSRIVSSPFRRARDTARIIAEAIGHRASIDVEHDLRERAIGELAGQPYGAMRGHPDYVVERFWEWRPAGGESLLDVQARAARVLRELMTAHPNEEVVVVSHGGVMLALCAHVEGSWTRFKVARNCELVVVEHAPSTAPRIVPGPGEGAGEEGGAIVYRGDASSGSGSPSDATG
jgi:broad specificity phosphatase PhoE